MTGKDGVCRFCKGMDCLHPIEITSTENSGNHVQVWVCHECFKELFSEDGSIVNLVGNRAGSK